MSLDGEQRERTRGELATAYERAGWPVSRLASALNVGEDRVLAALAVDGAQPADVWLVRDALDAVLRSRGEEPGTWTELPESARASAEGWFGLRDAGEVARAVAAAD
ncbi:DUF2316 family protein [Leifsonia shinshuensis]|uniref:DUF2316 family protein n=1 Tax=Leifsonia shinshuensis TaxID=150026 RepID=A0A7G6Y9V4_9MICO|nr:DUF2316 family protein [Leifsonia shinshuensis]QNE35269.1 DUF2316 family protein [Leifsonia shinshuensis]